ncbi:MAG: L,D-transpeptidase [Candidatus Parcubacteria bacterium]|nr:L,D-transpeptidase [Candidatus Parcubacteria bacterium]
MKKVWTMLMMLVLWIIPLTVPAQLEPEVTEQCTTTATAPAILEKYGEALCGDSVNFYCLKIGDTVIKTEVQTNSGTTIKEKKVVPTWEILWANTVEREIVMKINRRNIKLTKGVVLAVPKDMQGKTFMDYSPYAYKIDPPGEKLIIWDPALLAFGAYDGEGNLVRWGPAAGGKDYCPDVKRGCRTKTGEFKIIRKEGPNYRSGRYPVGCTGNKCAKMPYAAFFQGQGYAFHAGNVPGANASHGCIRVFYSDAEWLHQWLQIGTRVVIRPYPKKTK